MTTHLSSQQYPGVNQVIRDKNRVVLIKHDHDPLDDRVYAFFRANGFDIEVVRPYQGEAIADPDERLAGTVIYGGAMGAFEQDKHPFLREEYAWIDKCLNVEVPMLGICLGAQQIALHLGGKVSPMDNNVCEFGHYEVSPTDVGRGFLREPMHLTQSHRHTFEVPKGAMHLARSRLCENQAFRYGDKVYGFQFHAEVSKEGFRIWQGLHLDEWANMSGPQSRAEQDRLMQIHDDAQGKWFNGFMRDLIS